jgi:hypothetical protein
MSSNDIRRLALGLVLLVPTAAEVAAEQLLDADLPGLRFVFGIVTGFGAALIIGYALYRNAGREYGLQDR